METIMVKLSGESLKGTESPFNFAEYLGFAKVICEAAESGEHRILVSFGGGNVIRGKDFDAVDNPGSEIDYAGMLASVQNCLIFRRALMECGGTAKIVVPDNFTLPETCHASEITEEDKILLFGGGLGLPGHSTDISTVKNALAFGANPIVFLKNGVDGIYNRDPKKDGSALFILALPYTEYCERRLKVIDLEAAALLIGSRVSAIVTRCTPENLRYIFRDEFRKIRFSLIAE